MTIVKSCEELNELLTNFTFEDIGFKIVQEDEHFIEYYKKRRFRPELYVKVNRKNFESEVYTSDGEKRQGNAKKWTFNIHRKDELLFLLTHCLNELKIGSMVLEKYKRDINYDPADIIPSRLSAKY